MKLKNVGFFQRHLEKVVLGAAALFMLVIVAMYVLSDPFSVEVSNQRLLPAEIPQVIRDRAAELERRLEDDDPLSDTDVDMEVPELVSTFRPALTPEPTRVALTAISDGPPRPGDFEPPVDVDQPYYVPRPNLPENTVARADNAVLGNRPAGMTNRFYQDIVELVGRDEPRDFRYVSVEGEFNMDRWRDRLEQKPADAEGLQISRLWWARLVGVAGVYLQRQELDPISDEWVNTTIVEPLPHQLAFRDSDRVDWDRQQGQEAVRYIRAHQDTVQRPPFVPTRHRQWRPPQHMPAPLDQDELRQLQRLNRDIERTRDRIRSDENVLDIQPGERPGGRLSERGQRVWERLQDRREELEELLYDRDRLFGFVAEEEDPDARDATDRRRRSPFYEDDRDTGQRRDPRGQRQRPGRGQGPMPPDDYELDPPDAPWDSPTRDAVRRSADPRHEQPRRHDQPRTDQWQEPWQAEPEPPQDAPYGQDDPFGPGGADVPPWQRGQQDPRMPQMEPDEPREDIARVWAHDLTVEPGKTYRYRLVVSVLNPLFQQERVPDEQREQYYDRIALGPDEQTLAAAPWTDPVHVAPEYHFFLVGGSAENETAEVEVWRIYDGQWRRGEFTIRPGDRIAGSTQIDTPTGRMQLDLEVDAVLVDLMSSERRAGRLGAGDDMRMLYLDQREDVMADRSVDEDSESVERMRLESEVTLQQALAQQARAWEWER